MTHQTIDFVSDNRSDSKPWPIIGKGWPAGNGKGISITIGNKSKSKDGELVDNFKGLHLKPDQRLYLAPNTNMREGKKDPAWLLKLVEVDDESK